MLDNAMPQILNIQDEKLKKYRKEEIERIINPSEWCIKIGTNEKETEWLNITDDELTKIIEMLTKQ